MRQPTRREISEVLAGAIVTALKSLAMAENQVTLRRSIRALVHLAFDLAEHGDCPPAVMLGEIQSVVRKRLPRLSAGPPILLMKKAHA